MDGEEDIPGKTVGGSGRRKDHIVRKNLFSKLRSVQWGIIVYVGRD